MLGVDSDLGCGLQLHSDVNIGIFASANLDDRQSWAESRKLLG